MSPIAPVLNRREQSPLRAHQRDMLGWLILLSLILHLALISLLLTLSVAQPLTDEAEPLSVELIAGGEPAQAAPHPSVSAEASPVPLASVAPAQQADIPAPIPVQAPDAPVPPPVPHAQAPVPMQAEAPAPLPISAPTPLPPDVPSPPPVPVLSPPSPVQQAELPPPTELALPTPPSPPPPAQVPQAHPPPPRPPAPRQAPSRPASPSRAGTASATTTAQAQGTASQAAANRASAAANGAAWLGRLKQWWDQHSFYPREASLADEGGAVRVRIAIAPDGQVTFVQVVGSSGSGVLDAAALAVFRGARLPPLPPDAPAGPAEVVVTLHYRPSGSGG